MAVSEEAVASLFEVIESRDEAAAASRVEDALSLRAEFVQRFPVGQWPTNDRDLTLVQPSAICHLALSVRHTTSGRCWNSNSHPRSIFDTVASS